MTIDARPAARRAGVPALIAAALLLASCAGDQRARRGDRVDVSNYPEEIQAAYRVFAVRCSRCHTLARPLNARIHDPQHWIRYVTRMRRQFGSGINRDNAQIILRFLLYYHDPARADDPERVEDAPAPAPSPAPRAVPAAASVATPAAPPDGGALPLPPAAPPAEPPAPPEPPSTVPIGVPADDVPSTPADLPDRRNR